jgi:GT2 family glycosyltransferase
MVTKMIRKDEVAAVLVTFNRLELLKKVLNSLRIQTKKIDKIIIINNGSTDGTAEWLSEQNDIEVITQSNSGSSGGQARGFRAAYEEGFEWIWEMDDDVVPRPDCLEVLYANRKESQVLSPIRNAAEGGVFFTDTLEFNLTNPFKGFWKKVNSEKELSKEYIPAVGITFEGAFFHRSLIEAIGYPELNIFIYGDDSEYFIRADKAGFSVGIQTKAISDRLLPYNIEQQLHSPKLYFIIRNQILIDRLHGNWGVKNFRPVIYLLKWLIRSRSFADVKNSFKAFKDGWSYKPIYW